MTSKFQQMLLTASITCILLFLLPLICNLRPRETKIQTSPIADGLKSVEYKVSLLFSLSISLPLIIELFLRSWQKQNNLFHVRNILSNTLLLLALVVPNLALIFYVLPQNNVATFNIIMKFRVVFIVWSISSILYEYGHSIWKCNAAVVYPLLMLSIQVLSIYEDYCSTALADIIGIISFIFNLMAFALISVLCCRWYSKLYNINMTERYKLSTIDNICTIYVSILFVFAVCYEANTLSECNFFLNRNWYDMDKNGLTANVFITTMMYVYFAMAQGRAYELQVAIAEVSVSFLY